MIEARAAWIDNFRFVAESASGHSIVVDGEKKTANSPMELVLIGLCGCTGYDVVSILRKKREPLASLEVRAQAAAPQFKSAGGGELVVVEMRVDKQGFHAA